MILKTWKNSNGKDSRNLLRKIWKNNPENFEREKSPNIQFPETKSHFPCLFLSLHFMPPKKNYTCNDFVPGKGGHKLLEWSQQLGFTFPETYIDLIILYSTNLYIYISNLMILYKLQKIYDSHCCWVWRGNRYLNPSLKLCFFEKCVIKSQQHF